MTAPLPHIDGMVKIQFSWSYGTDANVMTHMYFGQMVGGPPLQADFQSFVNLARSSWVTNMLSLQSNAMTLRTVFGTYLGNDTYPVLQATGSNAGTRSGGAIPASTCALINLKIARRYRGGHPRLYIPAGVNLDLTDPQHWTASFVTAAQTGWNAWVTAMQSFSSGGVTAMSLANISYYKGGGLRPAPVWDPVTTSVVNPVPGTQRRRLRP